MTRSPTTAVGRFVRAPPDPRDGVWAALVGLLLRLAVVVWAAPRFPPAEDGHFFDVVARRIATGLGYTWAWPDGTVTYAAHYPVGYPALIGGFYAILGPHPVVAMIVNALAGALSVLAVHRIASTSGSRGAALLAALAVGLHPGLVFYTPALMTEGVVASLLAVAGWAVAAARDARAPVRVVIGLGLALGLATLIRPQCVLFAPLFGALAVPGAALRARARVAFAGIATAVALLCCLPWTLRNCERMNACVLVSANAGWNLFIGAAEGATGAWVPIERLGVPEACRTVWGEAEKDACFGRAGRALVLRDPWRFLSLVPNKLATTFDYAGAAGWYLRSSNPEAFSEAAKWLLGAVETVWQRVVVLAALAVAGLSRGPRSALRRGFGVASAMFLLVRPGWVGHLGLCVTAALHGRRLSERPALVLGAASVLVTALTHAVFFGAGRYSLVTFPLLSALAGTVLTLGNAAGDTEGQSEGEVKCR